MLKTGVLIGVLYFSFAGCNRSEHSPPLPERDHCISDPLYGAFQNSSCFDWSNNGLGKAPEWKPDPSMFSSFLERVEHLDFDLNPTKLKDIPELISLNIALHSLNDGVEIDPNSVEKKYDRWTDWMDFLRSQPKISTPRLDSTIWLVYSIDWKGYSGTAYLHSTSRTMILIPRRGVLVYWRGGETHGWGLRTINEVFDSPGEVYAIAQLDNHLQASFAIKNKSFKYDCVEYGTVLEDYRNQPNCESGEHHLYAESYLFKNRLYELKWSEMDSLILHSLQTSPHINTCEYKGAHFFCDGRYFWMSEAMGSEFQVSPLRRRVEPMPHL